MNNCVCRVPIPAQLSGYMQALYFEFVGARNLAVFAHRSGLEPDKCAELCRNSIDANTAYALATEELRAEYVPAQFKRPEFSFSLDWNNDELIITEVADA